MISSMIHPISGHTIEALHCYSTRCPMNFNPMNFNLSSAVFLDIVSLSPDPQVLGIEGVSSRSHTSYCV